MAPELSVGDPPYHRVFSSDWEWALNLSPKCYKPPGRKIRKNVKKVQGQYTYDIERALSRFSYYRPYFEKLPDKLKKGLERSKKQKALCSDVEEKVREYLKSEGYKTFPIALSRGVQVGAPEEESRMFRLEPGEMLVRHAATVAVKDNKWFVANSISPTLKQSIFSYKELRDFQEFKEYS